MVRRCIRQALDSISPESAPSGVRVVSLCAGDSRDILPVLAERQPGVAVRARLVEKDRRLVELARRNAQRSRLSGVEVVLGDAGTTTAFAGIAPVQLVLACGVFGNITAADGRRTVTSLRGLTAPDGFVVWTRGRGSKTDPSVEVRTWFEEEGFVERSFTAPPDDRFRVGMHQLIPASAQPYQAGVDMFSFPDD